MSQSELIEWIKSLPTNGSFKSSVKQEIISGIKKFAKEEDCEITGEDFYDCDDDIDIQGLTGINKVKSRLLFRKIAEKKQKDDGTIYLAEQKENDAESASFTLSIHAMGGKLCKIRNVSKDTLITAVKAKLLEELGLFDAANEYNSSSQCKDKSGIGNIELLHSGKIMNGDKRLGDYRIVNGVHLPLVLVQKARGS